MLEAVKSTCTDELKKEMKKDVRKIMLEELRAS